MEELRQLLLPCGEEDDAHFLPFNGLTFLVYIQHLLVTAKDEPSPLTSHSEPSHIRCAMSDTARTAYPED